MLQSKGSKMLQLLFLEPFPFTLPLMALAMSPFKVKLDELVHSLKPRHAPDFDLCETRSNLNGPFMLHVPLVHYLDKKLPF